MKNIQNRVSHPSQKAYLLPRKRGGFLGAGSQQTHMNINKQWRGWWWKKAFCVTLSPSFQGSVEKGQVFPHHRRRHDWRWYVYIFLAYIDKKRFHLSRKSSTASLLSLVYTAPNTNDLINQPTHTLNQEKSSFHLFLTPFLRQWTRQCRLHQPQNTTSVPLFY